MGNDARNLEDGFFFLVWAWLNNGFMVGERRVFACFEKQFRLNSYLFFLEINCLWKESSTGLM